MEVWEHSVEVWEHSVEVWEHSVEVWEHSVEVWEHSVEVWEHSVSIRGHQLTSAAISSHQRDRTSPRSTGIQGELVSTMASSIGGTQSHWSTWCSPMTGGNKRTSEGVIRRGHQSLWSTSC